MKNILIWGNGFLASHLNYETIKERARIDPIDIRLVLKTYKADVIINTIGFTGRPNIDQCEMEKEKTLITNTILPSLIATECDKLGIHLIQIGSGCIFAGKSPNEHCTECNGPYETNCFHKGRDKRYAEAEGWIIDSGWKETDIPNPVSYYSNTKAACDQLIGSFKNTATLRIRMPISPKYSSRNFISKVKGYKKIIDIPNSVSFTDDIVRCIDWMIENKKTGIYNIVNEGILTAADVMKEYQKHMPDHQFKIISGNELDQLTKAKRSNCILDGSKLKNEGFIMNDAKVMLEKTMKEYVENMKNGENK